LPPQNNSKATREGSSVLRNLENIQNWLHELCMIVLVDEIFAIRKTRKKAQSAFYLIDCVFYFFA